MLFNSIDFAVFLPMVFVSYWLLQNNVKCQNLCLLIASYVFYGWWDKRFLLLIVFSSFVDYLIGLCLLRLNGNEKVRKGLLLVSLTCNLAMLGYFKYSNFFLESFIRAFSFFGGQIDFECLSIILPVGISFYTFQTLSYSIDVYKRKLTPHGDIVSFFTFVAFFPQLVAGPIERATHLLPQFLTKKVFLYSNISHGMKLMIWGFFLKLVVADRAAIYVNAVYNNVPMHGGLTFLAATFLFAFQIYGDFAGYSLIAIGTAKLFGIQLMTNFKRPYLAHSMGEFWRRWHISLSTWLRDYLYIPLGGNRVEKPRWLMNLFITFLICGLWHGANWTFVLWGGLNGVYLIVENSFFKDRRKSLVNVAVTFLLVNFSWIFFRANTLDDAFYILRTIVTSPGELYIGNGNDIVAPLYATIAILMLVVGEIKMEYYDFLFTISKNQFDFVRMSAYAVLVFVILFIGVFGESQFIYFQF